MPRYMLDTDTCSYIMKRSNPLVLRRLQATPVSDVCMLVVTKAERAARTSQVMRGITDGLLRPIRQCCKTMAEHATFVVHVATQTVDHFFSSATVMSRYHASLAGPL